MRRYPSCPAESFSSLAEWLAEGIDQDADGQFAERSPAYTAKVVNPALLTLVEELHRPNCSTMCGAVSRLRCS